jgi:hypothetical protein
MMKNLFAFVALAVAATAVTLAVSPIAFAQIKGWDDAESTAQSQTPAAKPSGQAHSTERDISKASQLAQMANQAQSQGKYQDAQVAPQAYQQPAPSSTSASLTDFNKKSSDSSIR